MHFGFAGDDFRSFILVERNEATLNRRLDVLVSRVIFAMKFRQIVDVERTIRD